MKKTAISLILALAMVLSFVLVAAPQAEATGTKHVAHTEGMNHCACGGTAKGIGDHTTCTSLSGAWIDLNAYAADTANYEDTEYAHFVLKPGNYYLTGDLQLTKTMRIKAEGAIVNICLNGYNIRGLEDEGNGGRVIYCAGAPGAVINLTDCQGGGEIIATSKRNGVLITNCADVNIYSGIYVGHSAGTAAGTIRINEAGQTLKVYGGTFKNGNVEEGGGAISLNHSEGFIYGGNFENNSTSSSGFGAAIHLVGKSTMTILGGTFTGSKGSEDIVSAYHSSVKIVKVYGTATVSTFDGGNINMDELDASVTTSQDLLTYTLTGPAAPAPSTPTTPTTPSNPGTGDSANLVVMGLGLVLGVAGIACLLPKKQEI